MTCGKQPGPQDGLKDHLILATDLLKDCFLSCFEGLVRAQGSEKVLAAFKPYCINGGHAASMIIVDRLALNKSEPRSIATVWSFLHNSFRRRPDVINGQDHRIFLIKRCAHLTAGPEMCMIECAYIGGGVANFFDANLEFEMTTCIADGDPCCTQVFKPRSMSTTRIKKETSKEMMIEDLITISDEEAMAYYRAYLSELWLWVFKSSNDLTGSERTYEIFKEMMFRLGNKWGYIAHRKLSEVWGHDLSPSELVTEMNELLQQKGGEMVQMSDIVIREIDICPFSSAPPEVCMLFQEFMNGVMTAVKADHKLTYQKTMNSGATKCVWMVNKGASK